MATPANTLALGIKLLFLGIALAFVYWVLLPEKATTTPTSEVPDWDRLSSCSYATSLDGRKHLSASENHRMTFYDDSDLDDRKGTQKKRSVGEWAFDEAKALFCNIARRDDDLFSRLPRRCRHVHADQGRIGSSRPQSKLVLLIGSSRRPRAGRSRSSGALKLNLRSIPSFEWIAPSILLIVAVAQLPYGYYTFTRIIICSAAPSLLIA